MRTHLVALIAIAIGLGVAPLPAHADVGGAIIFVGKPRPHDQTVAADAIKSAAYQLGWPLSDHSFLPKDLATILACMKADQPWTCLAPTLQHDGVDRLAVVGLELQHTPTGKIVIAITEQLVAPNTEGTFVGQRYCEGCTDTLLANSVRDLTTDLIRSASAGSSKTMLSIRSTPPGAWITLDGNSAGATDAKQATYPGSHTVMLNHVGFTTAVRTVVAVEGKTTEVSVDLEPSAGSASRPSPITPSTPENHALPVTGPMPQPAQPHASHLLPGLVIGAGVVAVATGVVLIATDSKPSTTDLHDRHSEFYYSTTGPGIATAIGGAVAIGVGAYLWRRASDTRGVATLVPIAGGAAISWIQGF